MVESSFIKLCKGLNKKEFGRFATFCNSPYYNKHKDVKKLVNQIHKYYPNFDSGFLERHKLFAFLFPSQKFNLKKLKYVFSYSLDLLERFLATEEFENDEFKKKEYLMRKLNKVKNTTRFERHLKSMLKQKPENHDHYQWYSTHNLADLYFIKQPKQRVNQHLQNKMDQFDYYYLVEKIKNTCEMLNRQRVYKINFNYKFAEHVIEYILNNLEKFNSSPLILAYLQVYLTLVEPENEEHYFKLSGIIKQQSNSFNNTENSIIHSYAQNYCIRRINNGHKHFLRELFDLQNKMLNSGLLLSNNTLVEGHYKNFVTIAIRLNEFDWVHNFIEEYKNYLIPSVRENAYHYNLSYYYYSLKKYNKAFELLSVVQYSDYIYSLDAKVLLLKLYFDTEEWEALASLVRAHQQYLRRNKLLVQKKYERYSLLFRYTQSLSKLKQDLPFISKTMAKQNFEQLKKNINKAGIITNKIWLLERLDQSLTKY